MARLSRNFYLGDTVEIARTLPGKYLVRRWRGETLACRITETEAYVGRCDKACHAYLRRRTPRTEVLFRAGGCAYIYLIYGMYCCLNLVTEPEDEPAAVLIRGGEIAAGRDAMVKNRYPAASGPLTPYQEKNLLNGPGKLCKALHLTREQNGLDLTGQELFLCDFPEDAGLPCLPPPAGERLACGPRIGIDYAEEARDFPWRFYLTKED
jgi:DNA-3-methyladenine glycosylase